MAAAHSPRQNRLLAALPQDARERLYPQLELVPMPPGAVAYESGHQLRHVYFPIDSIVSLLYITEDGRSSELAMVGNKGIVGVALFMGGETMPHRAVVQNSGHAYRLNAQLLKQEFKSDVTVQHLLLRYTQALLTQITQTGVCNRLHTLEQQICRWLLLSLDRLPSNKLTMTQEWIANNLGVGREGVSEAAGKLQSAGLIHYSRGCITVLDRPRLEAGSCECYEVIRKEYERLLPWCGVPEGNRLHNTVRPERSARSVRSRRLPVDA